MTSDLERLVVHSAVQSDGSSSTLNAYGLGVQALIDTGVTGLSVAERLVLHSAVQSDGISEDAQFYGIGIQSLVNTSSAGLSSLERLVLHSAVQSDAVSAEAQFSGLAVQSLVSGLPLTQQPPIVLPGSETDIFLANWFETVSITSSWNTAVGKAPADSTREAIALQDRPKRLLQFSWMFSSKDEAPEYWKDKAQRLYSALKRMTGEKHFVPLYPDVVQLQGVEGSAATGVLWSSTSESMSSTGTLISSSGTAVPGSVSFDLSYKRFHDFKPVAIFAKNWRGVLDPNSVQYYNIDEVDTETDTISFIGEDGFPLLNFDTHTWEMVPMVYVDIVAEPEVENISSDVVKVSVEAIEVSGPTALPAWKQPNELVDLPYLYLRPDYSGPVQSRFVRDVVAENQGRGFITVPLGNRYAHAQTFGLKNTRDEWFALGLPLWDGLRGRWKHLLAREQTELQNLTAISSSGLTFSVGTSSFEDWSTYLTEGGYITLELKDRTQKCIKIVSVSDNTSSWFVELESDPQESLDSVCAVYVARVYNFGSDSITEVWRSPCYVQSGFSLLEDVSFGGAVEVASAPAEDPPSRPGPSPLPVTPFPSSPESF